MLPFPCFAHQRGNCRHFILFSSLKIFFFTTNSSMSKIGSNVKTLGDKDSGYISKSMMESFRKSTREKSRDSIVVSSKSANKVRFNIETGVEKLKANCYLIEKSSGYIGTWNGITFNIGLVRQHRLKNQQMIREVSYMQKSVENLPKAVNEFRQKYDEEQKLAHKRIIERRKQVEQQRLEVINRRVNGIC